MGDNTKWHRINIKLYPVILEKSLKVLGQPTNNYSLLGGGSNGHAYLSNNRVYKITTDKSEAVESNKLVGKNNSRIANIFDVKRINTTLTNVGLYLIILENLNTKRQSIFEEIENSLKKLFKEEFDLHFMDVIYFYRFYMSTYKNEYEKRVNKILEPHQREKYYYNSLLEIVDELKNNNIQSLDLQYHNLGLKPNGNLAYFDMGIGDAYGDVPNSIDIGENMDERNKTYMDNSTLVSVKKNCQLGGKSDGTSDACDQGDISNLELKLLNEIDNYELEYKKWKRDNVTYRGISSDSVDGTNNGMAMLGRGLYSVPPSNKSMARKYGKLVILVNAKPKNPKVFNTLNEWEIWFQYNVVLPISKAKGKDYPDGRDVESITDEMLKLGYDGIIIKGREIVNYKPENVRYFYNERQLEMYYDDFIAPKKNNEDLEYSHVNDPSPNSDEFMIGESLDVGSTFPKVGYRVGEKNTMRNLTVQDVLNFEAEELGNDYIRDQAMKLNIDYSKIPADKVIWVTMKPEDAERYKPTDNVSDVDVEEIHFSGKPIVIAVDDDNGYLVLRDSSLLNEDESSGFDLKKFDSLKSFAARKKYADQTLQKIGTGSSRIVYQLPDGNVLKLASNTKGIDQNSNECGLGQDNFFKEVLAHVIDCDQNDTWIVSEKAKKITPKRFEEVLGFKFSDYTTLMENLHSMNNGGKVKYHQDSDIVDQLYEEPFVSMMTQMMQSYDLMSGDLAKINSYGEVVRNGTPEIVLIDYGLNTDTWKTHYEKKKKSRYLWEDYFNMNEDTIVDINDLPFKEDVIKAGGKLYSVGGAVRDKLLGKESKDLDILITGIPLDQLELILSKYGKVDSVGKSFGIIKFNTPQTGEIDIAIPRTERKNEKGGYQGFDVTSDHSLPIEKDLERRDFTINAIAKDSSGLMIDPYCGADDIKNKCIRMVNPQAFSDDPLRMLRAVQFASRFNFNIEPETMKSIQNNAEKIKEISPERILIEFDKIVQKGNPLVGAKLLRQTNLYPYIFGSNRGINLSGFDKVKTMGEFIYMLLKDTNSSPSEFYKKNLKGDLDTYNEIKALEIGGEFRQDELGNPYKRIFDMYKIYPNIINTDLFGGHIKRLASEMKSKNIPFTLKEVPVNGNDLIDLGYKGKEIGSKFVDILNKIYRGELENKRESIMDYLNSKG